MSIRVVVALRRSPSSSMQWPATRARPCRRQVIGITANLVLTGPKRHATPANYVQPSSRPESSLLWRGGGRKSPLFEQVWLMDGSYNDMDTTSTSTLRTHVLLDLLAFPIGNPQAIAAKQGQSTSANVDWTSLPALRGGLH
jgi:hypothetical protein